MENENISRLAVKNSKYQIIRMCVSRLGGLIFSIILARMLLPELFGIYSLALSIVLIIFVLVDMGLGGTAIRYVSEALGKKNIPLARSYFKYLIKIKGVLLSIAIILILIFSKTIANNIFDKPLLYLPLVFSCLYILATALSDFITNIFICLKDIKKLSIIELNLQICRVVFALIALTFLSTKFKVAGVFIALASAYFVSFLLSLKLLKKDRNIIFGKTININKKRVFNFLKFTSLSGLSLLFFGSIDTLMLGYFVEATYIGFYRVALGLVFAISGFLAFSAVLLPIFIQANKERLQRGFNKTLRYTLILVIPAVLGIVCVGKYFVSVIYDVEYLGAVLPLYFLAILIVVLPLESLYSMIFSVKENPKFLAKYLSLALLINIVLNFIFIKFVFNFDSSYIMIGVALSTVISRLFYCIAMMIKSKKDYNLKTKINYVWKVLISSGVMVVFLLLYNNFVNLNLFLGILEVLIAIGIYFGMLFLLKELNKEDWEIIKLLKR